MIRYSKFLANLEELKTNKEMIQYCKDHGLKCLGNGSSRAVYAINDRLVVKIARNEAGRQQNLQEHEIWCYLDYDMPHLKQYFAKVHVNYSAMNEMFIVQDRLTKVTHSSHDQTINVIETEFKCWEHVVEPGKRDLRMAQAIAHVDETFETMIAIDIGITQLGTDRNGLTKIFDYGLNKYTWRQLYKSGSKQARKLCVLHC